jgi:hypothetical protein
MIEINACEVVTIGRASRRIQRKLALVQICSPQISHALTSNTDRYSGKLTSNHASDGATLDHITCNRTSLYFVQ